MCVSVNKNHWPESESGPEGWFVGGKGMVCMGEKYGQASSPPQGLEFQGPVGPEILVYHKAQGHISVIIILEKCEKFRPPTLQSKLVYI